jgi:hypothetical protein
LQIIALSIAILLNYFSKSYYNIDRLFQAERPYDWGKVGQFLDKVAKTVAKLNKNAKTSSSKLNWKVKIYFKPF